jgi:8-oxo-dGTP diphosphatase
VTVKKVNIAVGIIRNADKQIFITQRDASSHMAGFWEFPGGKIESGETAEQALVRELQEEVGICTSSWFNIGPANLTAKKGNPSVGSLSVN